jgi:hypothetical protein
MVHGQGDVISATARLVVQMTPEEKSQLDRRARRAGVSTAEFVRRRVGTDTIKDYRDEIEALLSALEASAPTILRSLDSAIEIATSITATEVGTRS